MLFFSSLGMPDWYWCVGRWLVSNWRRILWYFLHRKIISAREWRGLVSLGSHPTYHTWLIVVVNDWCPEEHRSHRRTGKTQVVAPAHRMWHEEWYPHKLLKNDNSYHLFGSTVHVFALFSALLSDSFRTNVSSKRAMREWSPNRTNTLAINWVIEIHSQNVSLPTCTWIMNHSIPAPTAKNTGRVLNTPSLSNHDIWMSACRRAGSYIRTRHTTS